MERVSEVLGDGFMVEVDVWGGLVVRRRKSHGWLFVGIGQKLFLDRYLDR